MIENVSELVASGPNVRKRLQMIASSRKCSKCSKLPNVLGIPNVSNVPYVSNAPNVLNVSNVLKVSNIPNVLNVSNVPYVAKVDVQTLLLLEKSQVFIVEKYFF